MHNHAYTLHNHLSGVTADQPHPLSEGADLPLRSDGPYDMDEIEKMYDEYDMKDRYKAGRGDGYKEGFSVAREAASAAVQRLTP